MSLVQFPDEVVKELNAQGAELKGVEDLRPALLGKYGYVGCFVSIKKEIHRVWVVGRGLLNTSDWAFRSCTAEWLTKRVAANDGEMSTRQVIDEFLRTPMAHQLGKNTTQLEAVSALAQVADMMDFCPDPLAAKLVMPADHPMRDPEYPGEDFDVGPVLMAGRMVWNYG